MWVQPGMISRGPCESNVPQGVPASFDVSLSGPSADTSTGVKVGPELLRSLPINNLQGLLDLHASSPGLLQRAQPQAPTHASPPTCDSKWGDNPMFDMRVYSQCMKVRDVLQELRSEREQDARKLLRAELLKPPTLNVDHRVPPRPSGSSFDILHPTEADILHALQREALQRSTGRVPSEVIVGDVVGNEPAVVPHDRDREHGFARGNPSNGVVTTSSSTSQPNFSTGSSPSPSQLIHGGKVLQPRLQSEAKSHDPPKKLINQEIRRLLALQRAKSLAPGNQSAEPAIQHTSSNHAEPLASAMQVGDLGLHTEDDYDNVARLNEQFIAKSAEILHKRCFSTPASDYIVKNTFVEQADDSTEKISWKHFLSVPDLPRLPVDKTLEDVEPRKVAAFSCDNLPVIHPEDEVKSPPFLHIFQ